MEDLLKRQINPLVKYRHNTNLSVQGRTTYSHYTNIRKGSAGVSA